MLTALIAALGGVFVALIGVLGGRNRAKSQQEMLARAVEVRAGLREGAETEAMDKIITVHLGRLNYEVWDRRRERALGSPSPAPYLSVGIVCLSIYIGSTYPTDQIWQTALTVLPAIGAVNLILGVILLAVKAEVVTGDQIGRFWARIERWAEEHGEPKPGGLLDRYAKWADRVAPRPTRPKAGSGAGTSV